MSIKVNFIGRLGADAETVTTQQAPFISCRVAVSDRVAGENVTHWVTVNGDYSRFKNMAQFLTKGSVLQVTGNLRCAIYHTKAGQTGIDYKVSADSIEFVNLGKKPTVDTVKPEVSTAAPTSVPEMTTGGLRSAAPTTNIPAENAMGDPFAAATVSSSSVDDDLPF